ncbi:tetratricopeptide repeat protein [Mucilaginibacter sp.]
MKIKLLMTGLMGLVSVAAFAQKGELNNAKEKYDSYSVEKANKITKVQGAKDLADAKTSIDKASVNEKTASLPLTFALKGAIYSSLVSQDTIPANKAANFTIAEDALKKAKSLDSVKQENKSMIHDANLALASYQFDLGREEFQNKKFEDAYKSFDYYRQIAPDDTLALYVTGIAAANAGDANPKYYGYAISSYNKLLASTYSNKPAIYYDLVSIYLATKDTVNALKTATAGVAQYPGDNNLRKREIEIGLQSGKQDILVSKIESAIAADPKNKTLYYYLGLTYSQIAEGYGNQQKKTKVAADKAALETKKIDNYHLAAEQYHKSVDLDPDYFEANLNLGYVILNPAIDEYNAANQLPTSKQKEYVAALAKSKADFDAARPYLQKAVDLNPKSYEALNNLKTYYLGTQNTAKANDIQKQMDALGGK